jgi:hypothetical protein
MEFIICGDINVNYLENNSKKVQLDEMFRTYNLMSTVNFPTRIIKKLSDIDRQYIHQQQLELQCETVCQRTLRP